MSKWAMVPLENVASPVERLEVPVPGKPYRQVGVRLWGEGAYERELLDGSETKYKTLSRVETNDIVMNKIWARNGSVAVVPRNLAGCYVSGEFPTFKPTAEKLEPRWFHWITKTSTFWEQCHEKSRGTSGKNRIRPERFLEIEIPLPSLAEQRRIVARIESLAAKIEEARALRERAIEEVGALGASAVSHLSTLKQWKMKTVGDLVGIDTLHNGKSVKSSGAHGPVHCLVLSSMRHGRINIQDNKAVPLSLEQAKPFLVHKRDIFVMRGNGSKHLCGQAGLAEEEVKHVIFPDLFIHIPLPESEVLAEYFVTVWNSGAVRSVIEEKAKTTSGIWKINQGHIASTAIPIPPLSEQRRIVTYLDGLQSKVDELKMLQSETAAELAALLPSILDKAFKGEL